MHIKVLSQISLLNTKKKDKNGIISHNMHYHTISTTLRRFWMHIKVLSQVSLLNTKKR